MALPVSEARYTPAEYLAFERQSESKNEYFNGAIFAMTDVSRNHNLISLNLAAELRQALKGRRCEVYASDMRVKLRHTSMYTYPDVTVVCDEPRFDDDNVDTLLNPTVIFEMLSPSTEAYDRGDKFAHYRRLASLQTYVLVSQDKIRVESFARQGEL